MAAIHQNDVPPIVMPRYITFMPNVKFVYKYALNVIPRVIQLNVSNEKIH